MSTSRKAVAAPNWPLYHDYAAMQCRCGFSVYSGRIWRLPTHACRKHRGLPPSYETIGADR